MVATFTSFFLHCFFTSPLFTTPVVLEQAPSHTHATSTEFCCMSGKGPRGVSNREIVLVGGTQTDEKDSHSQFVYARPQHRVRCAGPSRRRAGLADVRAKCGEY